MEVLHQSWPSRHEPVASRVEEVPSSHWPRELERKGLTCRTRMRGGHWVMGHACNWDLVALVTILLHYYNSSHSSQSLFFSLFEWLCAGLSRLYLECLEENIFIMSLKRLISKLCPSFNRIALCDHLNLRRATTSTESALPPLSTCAM